MSLVRSNDKKIDTHSYIFYKNCIVPSYNISRRLQKCLKKAFLYRDWTMAEHLVGKGAYINYRYESRGQTLLFCSATSEDIKALVKMGADINAKNKHGQSVLGYAIRACWSIDRIKLLLKYGANVNAHGPYGCTPFEMAIQHQSPLDLIKLMLEYGANINRSDKYNPYTPLGLAMVNRDCAKLLIKYGVLKGAADDCMKILQMERRNRKMFSFPEIDNYLEKCIQEVAQMKQVFLEKTTLYDFLNEPRNSRTQVESIKVSTFHVYKDIIEDRIERANHRNKLLDKLYSVHVHTPLGNEMVRLDYDSLFEVAKYLDNDDLESIVKAFFVN